MRPFSGGLALLSLALCLPAPAQVAATPSPNTTTLSDIRIVRLSQVKGKVEIDRNIGRGFEEAFANIPITGGTRLRTDVGLAEVEFEDNSALRLTPDSEVEFTQLKRAQTGATLTAVKVTRGMVYASLAKTPNNTFTIAAGETSVQLNPASHIRLTVDATTSNLSVLDGTVEFNDGSSTLQLKRKQALDFSLIDYKPPQPAKLEETAFDQWDKNGIEYQKQYSSLRTSGGMGLYGTSDLNYYGSFSNFGCGSMWRPYFASAGWSPYDNGVLAYYPTVGYSWVSPYPWGWLPFHSGSWVSCGSAGWGWMPGGNWYGLQNLAYGGAGGGPMVPGGTTPGTQWPSTAGTANRPNGTLPVRPAPPRGGQPAMIPVNARPLAVSSVSSPGTFTFRKDSAGLGVPRDAFGNLKSVSSEVAHHGESHAEIEHSFIGPRPGMMNANTVGAGPRGMTQQNAATAAGMRSVATFTRAGGNGMGANGMTEMRANGMGAGWGNNGMNSPGWSGPPQGSMQRPMSAGAPMPHGVSAAPASGGGSSASAGGSHK